MIDLRLTNEQELLRKTVRAFARDEVAPVIGELYERGDFPYRLVAGLGRMGLFGLVFDEEHGGAGGDFLSLCLALEELARIDSSVAVALSAGVSLGALPIHRFGSPEQKRRWLPALCAGEALAALGMTEPSGGTDAGALRTTAVLDGDTWVLNGEKCFITNAGTGITSLVTVTAVTGTLPDGGREISTIVVPSGTPGFTVAPPYSKVGWCASDTRALSFVDCRVPAENLLGTRGLGLAQSMSVLDESRIAIAAVGTGLAQGCVDECVRYARQRETFGRLLAGHQSIRFRIADMEVRAHTARLACYAAAAALGRGAGFSKEAAMAKLASSRAAMENSREATQVFGGYGLMNDCPVARFYRDAKVLEVGEGTTEVQQMVIAHHLGLG
ncbi:MULTISPECIES: acyl-CoA dehydrogenase family protein [unclassified Streptomyces]|uniref:acyl-CoA dehydrogenase family protein n=1 Tax=unclassified Streptomyces TaxID=2593676 RepID=UPI0024A914D0|nr:MULTISPECIES: acyl-CoA dehydrogenase family protein [unclassified Streptomyces]